MAKKYIKELADKLGKTLTADDGDHVKTIAPVYYRPADNSADSAVTTIQGALDGKAPVASPALTGTPTAPTAAAGTNTTQIATTAFVNTAITNGQYIIPDAYCSTASSTAAKTATCVGFTLTPHSNVPFRIYFTVANTSAGALTLSLNSQTAKPIYINGTASSATNYTIPIGVYWCVYDGTEFLLWTDKRFTGRTQGDGRNLLSASNYTATRFTATNPSDDINGASYTHNKVTGDSYIQIKATEPIGTGEMLTLSFDVSGLNTSGNETVSFRALGLNNFITHTINQNGRCVYYFTKIDTANITTGSVVNILDDTTSIYATAPSGITISNIKLERGFVADPKYTRHPSESRVAKADKIATSAKIGDTNKPVYIAANGTVTAISYEVNKSVPSDAVFTDHTYNFSGTTFYSGNKTTAEHDANNIVYNGNYYYSSNGPSTTLGADSVNDGALYAQSYSDAWVAQIAQDYCTGNLFVRGKSNGTWQSWLRIPTASAKSVGNSTTPVYMAESGQLTALSYTIAKSVPSNAVFTDTDTKQNVTLATTSKAFITGVTTTPTSSAQALTGVADTGVYLTTNAGELNATKYKINEACTMQYNSSTLSVDFVF